MEVALFGILRNILAFVGLMTLLGLGVLFLLFSPWLLDKGMIQVADVIHSPNNEFIAVSYKDMGGGAAGYCYQKVAILKSESELEAVNDKRKYVFNTECRTIVALAWQDNETVEVSYTSGSPNYISVEMYSSAQDGAVNINYVHKL
ncbi:hypothetical protein CWE15_08745 [Aliidiomarina taiwanensis]|uniref:Uncharacterized protein n=1 Tax=Aliidiomarina taiwanensis TaxID=946228 RepID=A0A432X110_9GAMM|nr:hypothetical protein CWE15_08745 [Aliidiomarina taiwanensis]